MAQDLELTIGSSRNPYAMALIDGAVQPKGIKLSVQTQFSEGLDNTGARHREILGGRLAGGECSTSSFLLARTRGVPLTAIPVFPARSFPHRQVYCHDSAPIQTPGDLAGKRVTVHRWNSTSPTWTKGLLENEYGVNLRSIDWFTAEPDPEGEGAPPDFRITRIEGTSATREKAVDMLARGEIDGGLDPYIHPGPGIRRVLPNWQDEAAGFCQRQQIYPMSHTVVLSSELLDQHPWVAESILEAFRASRKAADRYLTDEQRTYEDWLREVLDKDPHEYRLGPVEHKTLNELVRYQFQPGLRTEPIDPIACFALSGD
jgi:4,5-dihydroxyphthalate decarboxylase